MHIYACVMNKEGHLGVNTLSLSRGKLSLQCLFTMVALATVQSCLLFQIEAHSVCYQRMLCLAIYIHRENIKLL